MFQALSGAATPSVPVFAWVGRLAEPKLPDLFVEAVARVASLREVRGVIAGDGPLRPELEALARARQAPVTFLGYTPDVAAVCQGASAVVLTSRWEALSFAVQEAMWLGRPVVVSDLPGLRWLVGDAGYVVRDLDTLCKALIELTDGTKAAEMGMRAATRIRMILDPDSPFPYLEGRFVARRGS